MRLVLVLCFFLWPFSAFCEVDATVIHKIVTTELSALKMPENSPFCLAILPSANSSPTGADPSPQVLAFLSRKGMRAKRASTCYKAVKGNVISIELVSEDGDRLLAKVVFANVTIPSGEDCGVLRRRGVYQFTKDTNGQWLIKSYTAEIAESAHKSEP